VVRRETLKINRQSLPSNKEEKRQFQSREDSTMVIACMRLLVQSLTLFLLSSVALGFQSVRRPFPRSLLALSSSGDQDLASILTSRLPTSVDDQVRQAVESLKRANQDGKHRHSVRLLLPVIGATELDDWYVRSLP
jgi:hypothetical protein